MGRFERDLDNFITGHFGEDQFRGEAEYEKFVDECLKENKCSLDPKTDLPVWDKGFDPKAHFEELAREESERFEKDFAPEIKKAEAEKRK